MSGHARIRCAAAACLVALTACEPRQPPIETTQTPSDASPLAGAWEALEYELAAGPTYQVRGRIFFSETDWSVLFFVLDEDGVARRGSAEGGTYTLDGPELVFTHLYNLSEGEALAGLPAAPLQRTARSGEGPTEPSRVAIVGDRMQIDFPSGNVMRFGRRP